MTLDDGRKKKLEDLEETKAGGTREGDLQDDEERSRAARGAQLAEEQQPTAESGTADQQPGSQTDTQGTQASGQEPLEGPTGEETQKEQASASKESGKVPATGKKGSQGGLRTGDQKGGEDAGGESGKAAARQGGSTDGKTSTTAAGQKVGGGGTSGGGGVGGGLPRFDTPSAHDASVGQPLPSSFQHTEQVLGTAQKAAASPPVLSPETAAQPPAAQVGWAAKTAGFAGSVLHETFINKWSVLWDSKARGGLAGQFSGVWNDLEKAKGWEKVPPSLDLAYDTVSTIGGFLGPLSMVLGIVSYARYVPIPPIPAIGSALYVVSKVVKVVGLILDVVKLVIAALRPIVDVIMIAVTKDPEKRKKFQERLKQNSMDLAMAGFSVAFKTLTDKGFKSGRAAARAAGKGKVGAMKAGWKGMWAGKTQDLKRGMDIVRSIPKRRAVGLFKGTVDDAWNKAIAFRRLAYTQVSASRTAVVGATANRSGGAMVAAQRQSVSALRATVTGKGESMMRMASGTTGQVAMRSTRAAALRVGSGGITAMAGRSQSVTASMLKSSRHMDWGRMGEVGKEVFTSQVQGRLIRSTVKATARGLGPAPQASGPVAPGIEAGSEEAAKVTQKEVTDPSTPIFKNVPVPPDATQTAPGQLQAVDQQREVIGTLSKELEGDVLSAKAGQVEAKEVMKAAAGHRAGAEGAKGEVDLHQQKLVQEKETVRKGRQKVADGKAKQAKGQEGFGKVRGEGDRAKGAVPGGRVNRDDIPWHKKVFMWVVDKFEGAKTKVTDAMTSAIMKSVTGAAGLKDMDGQMNEADRQTQEQEQTLAAEPETLGQVAGTAAKEAQAAAEGEQKASQNLADNVKAEQEASKALEDAKGQESSLQKEENRIKADDAKFDSTYKKSFEHLNEQSDAAQAGDLTPLDIRLNEEVAAIKTAVLRLIQALGEHKGQVGVEAGRLSSEFKKKAGDLPLEQQSKVVNRADELKAEATGQAGRSHSDRTRKAQTLGASATGFGGMAADAAAIQDVSKLHGEVVSLARSFDEEKQAELTQMHSTFLSEYDLLFQEPAAAE